MQYICTYNSISSILIDGDVTLDFLPKIALRIYSSDLWVYTTVVSSSYDEETDQTTVNVRALSLVDPCTSVELSLIDPRSLPEHEHDSYSTGGPNIVGVPPAHEWDGSLLRFRNSDLSWGSFVDLLGPSMNARIAWNESIEYNVLDILAHDGSSYLCTENHISSATDEPGVGINASSYWALIAAKGDKGDTGDKGEPGGGNYNDRFYGIPFNPIGAMDVDIACYGVPDTTKDILINGELIQPWKPDIDVDIAGNTALYTIDKRDENVLTDVGFYNAKRYEWRENVIYAYVTNSNVVWSIEGALDLKSKVIYSILAPLQNGYLGSTGQGLNARCIGYTYMPSSEDDILWDNNTKVFRTGDLDNVQESDWRYRSAYNANNEYDRMSISFDYLSAAVTLPTDLIGLKPFVTGIREMVSFNGYLTVNNTSEVPEDIVYVTTTLYLNDVDILHQTLDKVGPGEKKQIAMTCWHKFGDVSPNFVRWSAIATGQGIVYEDNTIVNYFEIVRFPNPVTLFIS